MQYLLNFKHYDPNQGLFRKPIQSSTNTIKIFILKQPVHFSLLRLNWYNFDIILAKLIN